MMMKKKKFSQYRARTIHRARRRSTRLLRLISRETGPRRSKKRPAGRAGVLRTVLVLLAVASAGYFAMESGDLERLKRKVRRMWPATNGAEVKPGKSKTAMVKAAPDTLHAVKPDKGLFSRMFGHEELAPRAAALVRLDELYGLSEAGVVLPLVPRTYYNLPLVALFGAAQEAVPGDTLRTAVTAARTASAAARLAPVLSARISEIRALENGAAEVAFLDSPLRARITGRDLDTQVRNLAAYMSAAGKQARGLLTLEYGNIAYLKEEE
ncbi:MAG: hypothetical protein V1913_06155 [Fibrobacterota bacterium]